MDKQRSFSFKSTKCVLFSLTLSFSLLVLSFLSHRVMQDTNSVIVEAFLKLERKPSGEVVNLKTPTFSVYDAKASILIHALYRNPQNSSKIDGDLDSEETQMDKVEAMDLGGGGGGDVEVADNEEIEGGDDVNVTIKGDGYNGNLTSVSAESENLRGQEIEGGNMTIKGDGFEGNLTFVSAESEILRGQEISVKRNEACDVSRGRWVLDESYPLYTNVSCPFIDEGFNCKGNGRLDSDYMKWRWQPHDCNIPRFNATKMLEMMRGKRLVFVGDSINRNQWESMLCLLMGAVKDPKKVYETRGRRITKEKGSYSFRFVDYQCTVEFYVTHYLVHESKARVGLKRKPTLRIDSIDRGTSRWRGADILIFNTGNWWSHSKTRAGTNYYQEGNLVHPKLDVLTAFRRALTTWATWVDRYVNRRKTHVFFRSTAPSHFRGGDWNTGGHCREAKTPLNVSYVVESDKDRIATEVMGKMKTRVTFLNVTSLSAYRIDGHPSMYGSKSKRRVQDCSHWCLPGVPDAWNELLYHHLLSEQETNTYSK